MYEKTEQLNNCCFWFSLRRCLLTFGYARLILAILVESNVISEFYRLSKIVPPDELLIYIVIAVFFLIDAIFTIIFIAASHNKSRKLYLISNIYNITCFCLEVAYQTHDVVIEVSHAHFTWPLSIPNQLVIEDLLIRSSMVLAVASVQMFVVLMSRREMKKLQNLSRNMQLENKKAEAEALCVNSDLYSKGHYASV